MFITKKGERELCTGYCRLISIGGPRSMVVHSKSVSNWVVDSMGMEKLGGEQRGQEGGGQRGQQGGGKHVLIQDKGR